MATSGYVPLYDRILVRRDEARETIGDTQLHVADEYKQDELQGTVLQVGCGRPRNDGTIAPLILKPGDRVLFNVHSGIKVPEYVGLGKSVVMMREEEVMAYKSAGL